MKDGLGGAVRASVACQQCRQCKARDGAELQQEHITRQGRAEADIVFRRRRVKQEGELNTANQAPGIEKGWEQYHNNSDCNTHSESRPLLYIQHSFSNACSRVDPPDLTGIGHAFNANQVCREAHIHIVKLGHSLYGVVGTNQDSLHFGIHLVLAPEEEL